LKAPHLHPIPTYDDTEIRCISLVSRQYWTEYLYPFQNRRKDFTHEKRILLWTKRISFSKKKERKATKIQQYKMR